MLKDSTKLMTAAEFQDWLARPARRDRNFELIRGEPIEKRVECRLHGMVCANVGCMLGDYTHRRRHGCVCINHCGIVVQRNPDTVIGPDILLFDDIVTWDQLGNDWCEYPPALAVEVLSPKDAIEEIERRVGYLLHFGTPLIWLVDPAARNVAVYRAGRDHYVVDSNEELTDEDVLPDLRCTVAEFFKLPGQ